MRPETRVFVQALRDGKPGGEALIEYCWARLLVPIESHEYREDRKHGGDGMTVPMQRGLKAVDHAVDAFDADCSDDEIAAVFEAGLAIDCAWGIVWRPMRDKERPTQGQLLRAMKREDLMKTGELLGFGHVAKALVSR